MAWFTAPRGIELLGCLCTNLNCKALNTPVDKTGVNFTDCSQGVLRTVDAPSLVFRLNRALELIRCCEKELCEIQTCVFCLQQDLQEVLLCCNTLFLFGLQYQRGCLKFPCRFRPEVLYKFGFASG